MNAALHGVVGVKSTGRKRQGRSRRSSSLAYRLQLLIVGLFLGIGGALPLWGQAQPASDVRPEASVVTVLRQGQQLEEEERWLEALSVYEQAVREYPDSSDLKQRRTLARIHCDLDRRFEDDSYVQLVSKMSERVALDLYQELMTKIRAHYYDVPNWQRLTWRGTASLDIALTHDTFRQRYLPSVRDEQINRFRQQLRRDINQRVVRTHQDALRLVAYAAHQATESLQLPPSVCIGEYCCSGISALDQYSAYLTDVQLDDVYNQIEGNFVGLGIELKTDHDGLWIVKVIPGGPAERAGIRAQERIVAVDGVATSQVSSEKAADMLKGEERTFVQLQLVGTDGKTRDVRMLRERVEVPSVEDIGMLDPANGTGYFRLASFQKSTSRDVDVALWKLHEQGLRVLIMDLRGNPGGLLTAAVEVADKFLREGVIVSTQGRSPQENFDYRAHQAGTWQIPLIVLIDHDTASASEILAGAIRDQGRGTVIGEPSYGKGSVQGIFPLSAVRCGVRLTTARFYSPSGAAISDRGVLPHRTVRVTASGELAAEADQWADDAIMAAARDTARQIAVANR